MSPTPTPTPGQTVGPFFGYALPFARSNELVEPGTGGAVRLYGRVLDGGRRPIPDAMVEVWQLDRAGQVVAESGSFTRDGTFTGWGRAETDRDGRYWFRTLEPGPSETGRAAFFALAVFARGLQDRLFTRAYLPGPGLAGDALLASLPPGRRETLVAAREADGSLRFDVRFHGADETVFLTFDDGEHAGLDGVGA